MKYSAPAAAALAVTTIVAHYAGFAFLVSWGFRVPMGIVSCIGILLVAAGLICRDYHKTIYGAQTIFVIFAFAAIWARMNGIQLYPVPEGTGGWYRPASSTSLLSIMFLILAQYVATDYRRLIAGGVGGISIATMAGWFTLTADEALKSKIGSVGYSFPTAVCILLLCISTFRKVSPDGEPHSPRLKWSN